MFFVNCLSLDWSYFIDAPPDVRSGCFQPVTEEGHDDDFISFAWAAAYAEHGGKLKKAGVKPVLYDILRRLPQRVPVFVHKDHRHAYDVFNQYLRRNDTVTLLNVDAHPDTENGSRKLGSHNWLRLFMGIHREKGNRFLWLSDDGYKRECPEGLSAFTDINSSGIRDVPWDIIFIARSDMYCPPHLDGRFIDVFRTFLKGRKSYKMVQPGVWKDRYGYGFEGIVKELRSPVIQDEKMRAAYVKYQGIVRQMRERKRLVQIDRAFT